MPSARIGQGESQLSQAFPILLPVLDQASAAKRFPACFAAPMSTLSAVVFKIEISKVREREFWRKSTAKLSSSL